VVLDYLEKRWKERESPNTMKASMYHGGRCWVTDTEHPNYLAGKRATKVRLHGRFGIDVRFLC
jgi:nonspecific dipeptidase